MKDVKPMSARRAAVGLLWLAFGLVASPAAADDLTAEVVKQAQARQEKVKSFVVKLKRTEVLEPGAVMKGNKATPTVPKERTTLTSDARLVVQGSNFRYEGRLPSGHFDGTLFQHQQVVVSAGDAEKILWPNGASNQGEGVGIIRSVKSNELEKFEVWPLLMAFRGVDPALATDDLRRFTPSDVTSPLFGIPCRGFDRQRSGDYKQTFWIDGSGLIRRRTSENNGQLRSQTEIRYERRHGFDAFPVSWTSVLLSRSGAVQCERTLQVVEATINQPVADTELEITFPPKCLVHNEIDRKEYVVQADGSMVERPPSKAEAGPPGTDPSRFRGPIAVCLAAVLIVVVAACLTRLRRRKEKVNPPSKPA